MKSSSSQDRIPERRRRPAGICKLAPAILGGVEVNVKGEVPLQRESRSRRMEAVRTHPVAELLECPPAVGLTLNRSAQALTFTAGETVFHQAGICQGLYLIISGRFQRHAEWRRTRLILSPARAGNLLELAAALGDSPHNYTLTAQTAGSVLLLPMEALREAFQSYPPLRMRLLEELAREVSRAYCNWYLCRVAAPRRSNSSA